MRELGEPQRKVKKMEEPLEKSDPNANAGGKDRASTKERRVRKNTKKDAKRTARELKKKEQKEKKLAADKKKKEGEERLRRRGRKAAKGQPKITIWLSSEGTRRRMTHGERTGEDYMGWRTIRSRLRHHRRADARTEDRKNKNKCIILTD